MTRSIVRILTNLLVAFAAMQMLAQAGVAAGPSVVQPESDGVQMMAVSGGPLSEPCEGCGATESWYIEADWLMFVRGSGAADQAVVIDIIDGSTRLSTGNVRPRLSTGPRILIGRQIDESTCWEASYFGLFGGSQSATVTGVNNLAIPGDLGLSSYDYFDADSMTVSYESQLHSVELNRGHESGGWTWLTGLRYLNLSESFQILSTDLDTGTSAYDLRTSNNLLGAQVGGRRAGGLGPLEWIFGAKAGVYANIASQNQVVPDFPPPYLLRAATQSSTTNVAFVGELNLLLGYAVNEHWTLRGGYNLLWVGGVAMAPNQLDFTDTGTAGSNLDLGGTLFLHGVSVGVEARW